MLTKVCCDCRQAKRVELFDLDRKRDCGRSAQCKACRRQRQNRGGYATCRNRALAQLAGRHPHEYDHHREQARVELAPDSAPAQVWDQARGRALAELARRHQADWQHHYQQVRAAHPDWPTGKSFFAATNLHRRAHHDQYVALLGAYAGAKPAGPRLVYRIGRCAQRLLQLAHPQGYQALYAAERAKLGNPVRPRETLPQPAGTQPGRW
jgi:hypothetical protein